VEAFCTFTEAVGVTPQYDTRSTKFQFDEDKECSPSTPSSHGAQFKKEHTDNLTFTFYPQEGQDIIDIIVLYQSSSKEYEQKSLNHVSSMEDIRYPQQLLDGYRPIGGQRPGRPLKKLRDGYIREAGTGHLLA
jgi:hypothetical protein